MSFDINKLIGFAAYVMRVMGSDSLQYIMLIKLMYLSDRKFLDLYDETISNDSFVSMDQGPVLSRLLNLIHGECAPNLQDAWDKCFATTGYNINVASENTLVNERMLSRAEMKVIESVVEEFGKRDVWDLINNYMHALPEWKNPHGSSIPIRLEDMMKALKKDESEIKAVIESNEERRHEEELLKKALA
ncbi:Panacea domain-containing protein [Fibrobacter sp. UWEL]|uniref:Panacea domain-containing protein n=1 Tax=Fibrobacter sp. UWEL TaxID=1896209 RepID=UPI00090F40AD|nr:Panacea domain-containing protein [Fibrobacter sp. UWEL]SHL36435.1 Protein of unknown function [Fibrobacter sp. UWEL]